MSKDRLFQTRTMARLLARQGKLREAAAIYRRLCDEDPREEKIRVELAYIQKQLAGRCDTRREHLTGLLSTWIRLMLRLQDLRRLEAFRQRPVGKGEGDRL